MFPQDLGKCKIVQTGLDKCKFAQKNCLRLLKTVKNLSNFLNKFAQNNKNFTQTKHRQNFAQTLHKFVSLSSSSQVNSIPK